MSCYCDYDPATISRHETRKARKQHRCGECGSNITRGETYTRAAFLYDGSWSDSTMCCRCMDLRDWVVAHVPCCCWSYGNLIDDLRETINEYWHETVGLKFGFLRRLHAINKRATADRLARLSARSAVERPASREDVTS